MAKIIGLNRFKTGSLAIANALLVTISAVAKPGQIAALGFIC